MAIKERFVQLCNVASTTAEALENVVMKLLEENSFNIQEVCGQGYDGAANMSGRYNGLQSRIQRLNEKALYVHCHAHCLNLVLVESAKSNKFFLWISLPLLRGCTHSSPSPQSDMLLLLKPKKP